MTAATAILTLAVAYLAIGIVVGVAFVAGGIGGAMPDAGPVSAGARFLILPGCALLWPVILRRWMR